MSSPDALICNQFGFKDGHSTDLAVFVLKSIIDYYMSLSSPVYLCFIDASKAFDCINHCKLCDKLLYRKVPTIIVRLIYIWYSTQQFIVKWGSVLSNKFHVTNGVRQGGVLSPTLFNVYIDDLSLQLLTLKTGAHVNGTSINHLVYADDTVLIAPSASSLQKLIHCCTSYASDYDIIYNSKKTKCMVFRPKCFKDVILPLIELNGTQLAFIEGDKYLGYILSNDFKDDNDIKRQIKCIYATGNALIRNFKNCCLEVKHLLFQSYCTNLYCSPIWSRYKVSSFDKIRVAFNNVFRNFFHLKRDTSISFYMAQHCIDSFKVIIRKLCYGFMQRVLKSQNKLVSSIVDSTFFTHSFIYCKWSNVLNT